MQTTCKPRRFDLVLRQFGRFKERGGGRRAGRRERGGGLGSLRWRLFVPLAACRRSAAAHLHRPPATCSYTLRQSYNPGDANHVQTTTVRSGAASIRTVQGTGGGGGPGGGRGAEALEACGGASLSHLPPAAAAQQRISTDPLRRAATHCDRVTTLVMQTTCKPRRFDLVLRQFGRFKERGGGRRAGRRERGGGLGSLRWRLFVPLAACRRSAAAHLHRPPATCSYTLRQSYNPSDANHVQTTTVRSGQAASCRALGSTGKVERRLSRRRPPPHGRLQPKVCCCGAAGHDAAGVEGEELAVVGPPGILQVQAVLQQERRSCGER